jgi:hypothetical protein
VEKGRVEQGRVGRAEKGRTEKSGEDKSMRTRSPATALEAPLLPRETPAALSGNIPLPLTQAPPTNTGQQANAHRRCSPAPLGRHETLLRTFHHLPFTFNSPHISTYHFVLQRRHNVHGAPVNGSLRPVFLEHQIEAGHHHFVVARARAAAAVVPGARGAARAVAVLLERLQCAVSVLWREGATRVWLEPLTCSASMKRSPFANFECTSCSLYSTGW